MRISAALVVVALSCGWPSGYAPADDAVESSVDSTAALTFERDIRPILKAHCFDCHGAGAELEGGLDLRLRRSMVEGGESGTAIAPGDAEASYLLERVRAGEMPPGDGQVSEEEVATLAAWIAAGAPTAREEPEELGEGVGITPEERAFWSFQPIARPELPTFGPADRVRTPIDALLVAQMRDVGLSFSPDAGRRTLVRRAYLDLIGLPPTPEQVQEFVEDESPDAYERLIDRLLDSAHYGERWGRHWLDVAGYADTEGYTNADADRPWAYFYRDYVIRSLNEDKPFDQFLQEQLAGDEMAPQPYANLSPEAIEKLTATGFLRMAADGTGSGANDLEAQNQTVADTIKIVSTALLGLSVGCAQCHDHRYDPIPQVDYYQLRAVFAPALDTSAWRTPAQRRVSLFTDVNRASAAEVEAEAQVIATEKATKQKEYIDAALSKELEKHPAEMRDALRTAYRAAGDARTEEQKQLLAQYPSVNISAGNLYQYNQAHADELKTFDARMAEVRTRKPIERFLRVLAEVPGQVPETHVFHRGDYRQPTEKIAQPAGLTIAAADGARAEFAENDASLPTSGRRLAYAKWLTSGRHPLVGRVLVNRVWMHHFGRGIVSTPSDFGVLGERPTHPKLLDFLADEFVQQGWSLKRLHRLIMTSTVYRQTAHADPEKLAIDGANRLYWKWPVRRLDAEVVRDSVLAVSGTLDDTAYGEAVKVKADDAGQVIVEGERQRRSIYVQVKRSQPMALLKAFDAPVMEVNCERRPSSTVAPQSLMLMNSEFILQQARKFAQRARDEAEAATAPAIAFDTARLESAGAVWQYGYGRTNEEGQSVEWLGALPHWTGSAWQGGAELPDAALGWATLNAGGGHPGRDYAVVRRWTAPAAGVARLSGRLTHPAEQGNGVRGRVIARGNGTGEAALIAEWVVEHGDVETVAESMEVAAGDVLDLVVDCRGDVGFDSFVWPVVLELETATGERVTDRAAEEFQGPTWEASTAVAQVAAAWWRAYGREATVEELSGGLEFLAAQVAYLRQGGAEAARQDPLATAMTNLCQVLLGSNEFLYVQ